MVWPVQQDKMKSVIMSKFVVIQLFLLALYSNMLFAFTIPYMKFIYNFYCFKQKKKKNQTSFSKEAKLYKVLFRKYP